MAKGNEHLPEKKRPDQKPDQLGLADLMKLAEPLLKTWTENDDRKHSRELEYETKLLGVKSSQSRITTIGLFSVLTFVLIISLILFLAGRDDTAMDLIKLIVGLGGAAFGGFGWAMSRRRAKEE